MQVRVDLPVASSMSRRSTTPTRAHTSTTTSPSTTTAPPSSRRPRSRSRTPTATSPHAQDEDPAWIERRSSYHAQQAPVPTIPARFLDSSRASQRLASKGLTTERTQQPTVPGGERTKIVHRHTKSTSSAHIAFLRREYGGLTGGEEEPSPSASIPEYTTRSHSRASSAHTRKPSIHCDDRTLLHLTGGEDSDDMALAREESPGDLFLQVAQDSHDTSGNAAAALRVPNRASPSILGKRKTLRAETLIANTSPNNSGERRPSTAGGRPVGGFESRPASRARAHGAIHGSIDMSRFRTPRAASQEYRLEDDTRSLSGRKTQYPVASKEHSPLSPWRLSEQLRSPDQSLFGRRRPSFGAMPTTARENNHPNRQSQPSSHLESGNESPAETSERKASSPESSESVDSQTAPSTVWDELSDLKSRIKALEVTGKLPPMSGSGATTNNNTPGERPRTATTAPTTVGSSPKQSRKPEPADLKAGGEDPARKKSVPSNSGTPASTSHPTLHAALAKAKSLLAPSLYRTLEATTTDALQLAAMAGAGPQGAAFSSAASIITGSSSSDRQVRRKADAMCRNLTDLCLALCEGKHEPTPTPSTSLVASPISLIEPSPRTRAPTSRFSRATLALGEELPDRSHRNSSLTHETRPMSRLEARRSSIFGHPTLSSPSSQHFLSPEQPRRVPSTRLRASSSSLYNASSTGASEQEDTEEDEDPTIRERERERRRSSLAPPQLQMGFKNTLAKRHSARFDPPSGADEPSQQNRNGNIRPVSRAMTDIGNNNGNGGFPPRRFQPSQMQRSPRESTGASGEPRSPKSSSFRETLVARRNHTARDENTRVSSLSMSQSFEAPPRRRWARESTPPVMEEEREPSTSGAENNLLEYRRSERYGQEGERSESRFTAVPSRLENAKRRLVSAGTGHRYSSARTLELAGEGRERGERRSVSSSLGVRRREAGLESVE